MSSRTIFWNQFSLCSNADGTVKYHGQFTFCNVIILHKQLLRARTYCHFRNHTSTSVRVLLLDSTSQCLIHLTLSSIFAKEETKWEIGDGVDHYKFVSFAQCPDAVALTNVNNNGSFGPGTGPIFLTSVGCRGNETNLFSCRVHFAHITDYCSHSEDAGVICPQGIYVCACAWFHI